MPERLSPIEDLASVRIAKDLFLSDWYDSACEALGFSDEACGILDGISHESERERATLLRILRDWPEEAVSDVAPRVARVNRLEFLRTLYEAKTAAGSAIERIAVEAPPRIAERLLNAAAIDFKHATRIQRLIEQEIEHLAGVPPSLRPKDI